MLITERISIIFCCITFYPGIDETGPQIDENLGINSILT